MKLVRTLLAACAAALALGATAQAATFDQVNRQADNKLLNAVPATKQVAVQFDAAKKAPLILAADYTPAQKPQIALFDTKKAETGAFAANYIIGAGKAVDFKKLDQIIDMGGANKVAVNGTTQQFAGNLIARASAVGRGDGVSPGNVIS